MRAREDERDRATVAVPEKHRTLDSELLEHLWKHHERLVVHVVAPPRAGQPLGASVAEARVGDDAAAGPCRELRRKAAPQRH